MANDGFFIANRDWQIVELDGEPIKTGTFNVVGLSANPVGFIKSTIEPSITENGVGFLRKKGKSLKYELVLEERLFAKSSRGPIKIGIVPA